MKFIFHLIFPVLTILVSSCGSTSDPQKDEVATPSGEFQVEYSGALKNIMHGGDVSANADLSDFKNTAHFYALGALENLKGEIQIFDSKPFNSTVVDSTLSFDKTFNKKATLLVYVTVNKWKSIAIPDSVTSYEHFENYLAVVAKENQLDLNQPFPFLIEGTANSVDWHVIKWKDGDMEHSHEKHINSGLNGTVKNDQVEMLGFYSNSHHAIFTHHTTNMHVHFRTADNKIAGHADDFVLGENMTLRLPDLSDF